MRVFWTMEFSPHCLYVVFLFCHRLFHLDRSSYGHRSQAGGHFCLLHRVADALNRDAKARADAEAKKLPMPPPPDVNRKGVSPLRDRNIQEGVELAERPFFRLSLSLSASLSFSISVTQEGHTSSDGGQGRPDRTGLTTHCARLYQFVALRGQVTRTGDREEEAFRMWINSLDLTKRPAGAYVCVCA